MKRLRVRMNDAAGASIPSLGGMQWRGAAFAGERLHDAESLPQALMTLPPAEAGGTAWQQWLAELNGFFAMVWQDERRAVCAVDRLRSIPLYYGEHEGEVFVGDDADWVRRMIGADMMDPLTRDEFQLTGYVTGRQTLFSGLRQLQAGEMLIVEPGEGRPVLRTERYFRYLHDQPPPGDAARLRDMLEERMIAAARRLVAYAGGRQIAIPLSGGYDSRLVATLLASLKADNLIAFSYGAAGNREAAFSQRVAQRLGIPWHFVEYSKAQVRQAWASDERRQYQQWASGWVSLPHIQDWVAVRSLKQQGVLREGCVFAPGHTCFRRNTGVTESEDDAGIDIEALISRIRGWHYCRSAGHRGPDKSKAVWRDRILAALEVAEVGSREQFASAYEKWEWQERQTKFIGNSVRVYEFFGYDWWMPLWDARLMDFARGVPLSLRYGRRWYNDFVVAAYAAQAGAPAGEDMGNAEDEGLLGKFMRSLALQMPDPVRQGLKRLRDAAVPARLTHSYAAMHLSEAELKQLRSEGYRNDGLLVRDFLNSYGQL